MHLNLHLRNTEKSCWVSQSTHSCFPFELIKCFSFCDCFTNFHETGLECEENTKALISHLLLIRLPLTFYVFSIKYAEQRRSAWQQLRQTLHHISQKQNSTTFLKTCIKKDITSNSSKKRQLHLIVFLFDSNKLPESFPLQALCYKSLTGFFSCFLYKFPF